MGISAADYDADGDFDLYLTGYGGNRLLRNEGGFRFVDVTEEAGVGGGGFSAGSCWGDFDGDGDLDLYVCRYVRFDESMPVRTSTRGRQSLPVTLNPSAFPAEENLLFRNEGGRFVEVAGSMGVTNPGGKSLGALFADFDGDDLLDLYVANDVSDNAMFRGRGGDIPFEDVTHPSCTADWRGAMGLAVGDPDLDRDLDLFITHWMPEENTLYVKEAGRLRYRDDSERTYLGPPGRGHVGWACDFADFDNDGRPDLYVVNGSTFEEPSSTAHLVPMPLQLFWNGGRRFFDLALRSGGALATPVVGRGGSVATWTGTAISTGRLRPRGGALLLRNDTEKAFGSIEVTVRGSAPNPFGYGALVTVESEGARRCRPSVRR
ncbi:MAG: VCBS repeat-containing protein [Planctomycetes bacterium]|nr:VCBS repeat-containing protein [Planctomycetota bacterium]